MDESFVAILKTLNCPPNDKELYKTAFTHRSFLNEAKFKIESNERLEFLGDSVLSFIISSFLYKTRTEDNEGSLTNLRSFIVKTESLAKASLSLDLGSYLQLSKGEELSGGRDNPQLLANTYEALLGAIFLDQGIEKASLFVHQTLVPFFEKEVKIGAPRDSKSQLQEVAQDLTKTAPKYKIIDTFGPDHAKIFRVGVFVQGKQVGVGEGSNKQQAEEEAAKEALVQLTNPHS
jgi:ribonuclease-3